MISDSGLLFWANLYILERMKSA